MYDAAMNVSAIPLDQSYLEDRERQIEPGRCTILSIFPVELTRYIPHAGLSTYFHPAASKDKIIHVKMNPARMTVQRPDVSAPCFHISDSPVPTGKRGYTLLQCVDTYQWVQNYEREKQEPLPITAESAATSLVREWTQARRVNQGAIGIALLDAKSPISAQVDRLWESQTAYFRSLVIEADGWFVSTVSSERASIAEIHRKAAEWLGTENRPWFRQQEEVRMKTCPQCSERIMATAIGCKECQVFLPDFYRKYKLPFEHDTAVSDFYDRTGTRPKA
jgi:hypothetical protein